MVALVSPQLQFTRDGRQLVWCEPERVMHADANGRQRALAIPDVRSLAVFADQVWTADRDGFMRWTLDGRALGDPVSCGCDGVLAPALVGTACARWSGLDGRVWVDDLGTFRELAGDHPFAGRRTLAIERGRVLLGGASWSIPTGARVLAGGALFDGAGVVLALARGATRELWIASAAGALNHRMELPAGELRIAARRGLAIVHAPGEELVVLDLRFGTRLGTCRALQPDDEVAIDAHGEHLAMLGPRGVAIVTLADALAAPRPVVVEVEIVEPPAVIAAPPAPVPEAPVAEVHAIARPLELAALSPRRPLAACTRTDALAALEDELALVGAWALAAIADAWDTRRLGYANESVHPHEHEVAAILGRNRGFAAEHVAIAREELAAQTALAGQSGRRGPDTPLGALAAELGLSPLAVDILLVVAAPTIWGEAARLYGILSNDAGRPIVDELLVHQVLGARATRHDIASELDPRAPLLRSGAIATVGGRARPFVGLAIDPVVVSRLRAEVVDLGAAVTTRIADRALEAIHVPGGVLAAGLAALADAGPDVRIAISGKRGSGRRTLLAALAGEAHRPLGLVDAALLPAQPEAFVEALRVILRRVHLGGLLPCVVGLDEVAFGEHTVGEVVGEALRAHPGALALVLGVDATAPLDPGHVAIALPTLDEGERIARWRDALAERSLWVRDLDGLAARYRVTPGLIVRAVASASSIPDGGDASDAVERYVRQARDARLGTVAKRVERLASWANLVLPSDVHDSVRELIARVRHRRTVFEQWGMGNTIATARGITAMFQGQPGTGKTLVAGVIARELGLDLYQVDLSKVMSKWIGETERNLATVFDAAEDGQVILLFDEADSLFAKRTEVRSSNDRYANLEVNYLLQRLDSFEGIAILTTNFGGSIDPAFKRRMSFRLSFPFPDEETRTRLWRAHLPPQLPIGGELALDKLARKYQLTGGYIRNACLRAAFLAAEDEGAVCQDHLERAVALEFAELGKLSSSGAID